MKLRKTALGVVLATPLLMTSLPSQAVIGNTSPPEIDYQSCETVLKAREDAAKSWAEVLDKNRKETLGQGVDKDIDNLENCGNKTRKMIEDVQKNIKSALSFLTGGFSAFSFDISSFISGFACKLEKEIDKKLANNIKSNWSEIKNQYSYAQNLPYGFGKVKVGLNGTSVSGLITKDAESIGEHFGGQVPLGAVH